MRTPAFIATCVAAAAFAAPAQAHVTASPPELPAEGYGKVDLSVPHGCEESPTTRLIVRLPDEVQSATPQVVPGWRISTKEGKLAKPHDSHGEQVTTGVREITWEGGPLDAHQLEVFGVSVKVSGTAGDQIAFKIIQQCKKGETAWVEIPVEGEEEPPAPAAMVTLVEAEDDHGAAGAGSDAAEAQTVGLETTAATTADDGPSTGLVVAALVIGGLGLLVAIVALLATRRRPTS